MCKYGRRVELQKGNNKLKLRYPEVAWQMELEQSTPVDKIKGSLRNSNHMTRA